MVFPFSVCLYGRLLGEFASFFQILHVCCYVSRVTNSSFFIWALSAMNFPLITDFKVWDQVLSLVLELLWWSPFILEGNFTQPRYRERACVLPQRAGAEFIDTPWEALPSLRIG